MQLRLETPIPRVADKVRLPVRMVLEEDQTLSLSVVSDWVRATHQMTSVFGIPLIVHRTESDEVISGSLVRDGFWEFAESMLLLSIVRPGMTVLDVGANLGYYTAVLARLVGKRGRFMPSNPIPTTFKCSPPTSCSSSVFFPSFRLSAS